MSAPKDAQGYQGRVFPNVLAGSFPEAIRPVRYRPLLGPNQTKKAEMSRLHLTPDVANWS